MPIARTILLLAAALTLGGCVIAPGPGDYRPYPHFWWR